MGFTSQFIFRTRPSLTKFFPKKIGSSHGIQDDLFQPLVAGIWLWGLDCCHPRLLRKLALCTLPPLRLVVNFAFNSFLVGLDTSTSLLVASSRESGQSSSSFASGSPSVRSPQLVSLRRDSPLGLGHPCRGA